MAVIASVKLPGGYRLELSSSVTEYGVRELTLKLPLQVLEADVKVGVLGEAAASLLLVEPESVEGEKGVVGRLAWEYRARVVREELGCLRAVLGRSLVDVKVPPAYAALSRARSVGLHYCMFNEALERGIGELDKVYRGVAAKLGLLDSRGSLFGNPGKPSIEAVVSVAARSAARLVARLAGLLASGCRPHQLLVEPWRLVEAPEGRLALGGCRGRGPPIDCSCSRPSIISSSLLCECNGRRVVVKRYSSAVYKWILAAPLAARYRFRLSPHSRASAEYFWLRAVRGAVETPSIVELCVEPFNAYMVRGYIEGTPLSDSSKKDDWIEGGAVLARVHHGGGASVGDANPTNIILGGRGGIIDMEQAREYTAWRGAWDITVAASYSAILLLKPSSLVEALIEGYMAEAPPGEASKIARLLSSPGFLIQTPTPPHVAAALRRAVRRSGSAFKT